MTQKPQHTPGKWVADKTIMGDIMVVADFHGARPDKPIASIFGNDEANAAFIVRACNSHDALVKFVADVLYANEMRGNGASNNVATLNKNLELQGKEALALAKGE